MFIQISLLCLMLYFQSILSVIFQRIIKYINLDSLSFFKYLNQIIDSLVQKMQASRKHKKALSNFHHINHDYNQEKQRQRQKQVKAQQKLHKRVKSFSKDYHRSVGKLESNREHFIEKLNRNSDQIYPQLVRKDRRHKNQNNLKFKKQQFVKNYMKSESQSKRNKKNLKLQLKPKKQNPSKSDKKITNNNQPKSARHVKQRKHKSKQISLQKNSKDSKNSKNSKQIKSGDITSSQKIQEKREIQNKLGRGKKGIQINFKKASLKDKQMTSQLFPMSPGQVSCRFQGVFDECQMNQMREYKHIYFLGNKFMWQNSLNVVKSARQKISDQILNQQDINFHKNYYQTQNLSGQKKASQEEDTSQFYSYQIGSHIAYRYQIIASINRGSFGEVLRVRDHKTSQLLAIKIVKKSKQLVQQTFVEISILTHVKENDKGNTSGIVRIKDFLLFRNHICIIFQLLDGNLYELLTANGFKGFSEEIIRVFAVQILNSLNFLRKEKIVHCDLKPENLVMKNWGKSGVKLIDFGTSCFQGKQMYSYLQSRYYRAPQVLMQMPYSFPIDMWSFGCMIAQFKLGQPLFSGRSSVQQLIYISSCIGLPNKNDGLFSLAYLQNSTMKQMLQKNYIDSNKQTGLSLGQSTFMQKYQKKLKRGCLFKLQQRLYKKGPSNPHFLNFLEGILVWEPDKRLTPEEALRHPWITKGLSSQIYSLYSNFNTSESYLRSKKNSKDSKRSNQSKKSNRKNSKKQKIIELKRTHNIQKTDKNQQNKINFPGKRHLQQNETFVKNKSQDMKQTASLQNNKESSSLNCKKNLPNLNRYR